MHVPQTNRFFIEGVMDSGTDVKFGGYITSLEAVLDLDYILITQTFGFQKFNSSRYFDEDIRYIYTYSNLMDWGLIGTSSYCGLGNLKQEQNNLSYKFNLKTKEIQNGDLSHKLMTGFELSHQDGTYQILKPFMSYINSATLSDGYICQHGDRTCINDDRFGGRGNIKRYERYGDVDNKANLDKISIYLEDEMNYGRLKIRPGVRLEHDSFSKDFNIAPRFVTEYDILGDDTNFIGFGLKSDIMVEICLLIKFTMICMSTMEL